MINEELDKFHQAKDQSESGKDLKLIVDFETDAKVVPKKQMEIEGIKYKKRKKVIAKELDLTKKKSTKGSIF